MASVQTLRLLQHSAQLLLLPLRSARLVQREAEDYSEILPTLSLLVLDSHSVEVSQIILIRIL